MQHQQHSGDQCCPAQQAATTTTTTVPAGYAEVVYYPPTPAAAGSTSQQDYPLSNSTQQLVVGQSVSQSFVGHVFLSVSVLLCCGCLWGIIALILARK